ncbi:MAG: SDR family oxidoreductase [Rhodospirillales bacterium]
MTDTNSQQLKGQVALITGCVRRIGRAMALSLAKEGAAIVVHARSSRDEAEALAKEIEAMGGRALVQLADVTKEDEVKTLVDTIVDHFGRLDILINNAAIRRQTPFLELSLKEWHEILEIVLDGAFLCSRACVPHMIKAGGGAIINMGGLSPYLGSYDRLHVETAKMGLVGFTRGLAIDVAKHGITVNLISPGGIGGQRSKTSPESSTKPGGNAIPLGREGTFENIANMAHALCIPAGRYITGQSIHVNGGRFMGF